MKIHKEVKIKYNIYLMCFIVIMIGIFGAVIMAASYINNKYDNNIIDKLHKEKIHYSNSIIQQDTEIQQLENDNINLIQEVEKLKEERKQLINRGKENKINKVKVTFYTLSVASCGKNKSHPEYGITANGYNLKGKTLGQAKTIAVDPEIIPLGSTVIITFLDEKYSDLNGEYIARDTGRLIKGDKIDIYVGENNDDEALGLGIQDAYIEVLEQ